MKDNTAIPITPEGKRKLEEELEHLTTVRRKEIAARLKEAIAHGDLRENAGYEEAKNAQALLELRIQELTADLAHCVLIEQDPAAADTVAIGRKVIIREKGVKLEETYVIVGKAETDPARGRISNESPMGQALLGQRVGDTVAIATPAGTIKFHIVRIEAP